MKTQNHMYCIILENIFQDAYDQFHQDGMLSVLDVFPDYPDDCNVQLYSVSGNIDPNNACIFINRQDASNAVKNLRFTGNPDLIVKNYNGVLK